jgi:hypothetical protein
MAIQHSQIPDNQRHEPKGISTAANRTVYVADGAASGVWRKYTDKDVNFSNKADNLFGWNDVADSLYTNASPRAINSATRTKLTNNALAAQTDISRLGVLWNTGTNSFQINDLNAVYKVNIKCKVKASAAAGTPYTFDVEVQSANGPTVIAGHTQVIKGGNHINFVNITVPVYMGSFINNQALEVYVTADTNITLYDVGFVVQRTYVET